MCLKISVFFVSVKPLSDKIPCIEDDDVRTGNYAVEMMYSLIPLKKLPVTD